MNRARQTTSQHRVFISKYTQAGDFRGGFSFVVPARSVHQFNDVYTYLQAAAEDGLTVEVRGAFPLYVWASTVRNDTGDAAFIVGHEID